VISEFSVLFCVLAFALGIIVGNKSEQYRIETDCEKLNVTRIADKAYECKQQAKP